MTLAGLKQNYPNYQITQLTFIMDALCGFSGHLKDNINAIIKNNKQVNKAISNMQKTILNYASRISTRFKLVTNATGNR